MSNRVLICEKQKIFVRDSQGILKSDRRPKKASSILKLAALNSMPPDCIPKSFYQIADLQLFHLNRRDNWEYMSYADLNLPSDNIDLVLQGE